MARLPKLHLGCGRHYWPGFINIDSTPVGDIQQDITLLEGFQASEIHAIHVIEHLERFRVVEILERWRACLEPGGKLALECPDLDKVLTLEREPMMRGLFGDFKHEVPEMMHRWCYTGDELKTLCEEAGFSDVRVLPAVFHKPTRDMRIEATNGPHADRQ
jgi:predicted SAM-dependent methyltransferase